MRLYISGPISMHSDTDYNFPAFNEAARILYSKGYDVFNPADKGSDVPNWKWEDYMRYDLKSMLDCQGVAVLPNWENSPGAALEVHVARALKMNVMTVQDWCTLHALSWSV